jgi:hypothetical protein
MHVCEDLLTRKCFGGFGELKKNKVFDSSSYTETEA